MFKLTLSTYRLGGAAKPAKVRAVTLFMDAGFPMRKRCSLAALSYRKTKDGSSTMLSFEPQSPPMSNEVYGRCENCRLVNACQHDTVQEIDVGTSESAATRLRTICARPRLDCTTPHSSESLSLFQDSLSVPSCSG